MFLHVVLLASGFLNTVFLGMITWHYLTQHGKPALLPLDDRAERVKEVFRTIAPLLAVLYPIVDAYRTPTGRPPVCHRFQLRFLLFYLLFWKGTIHSAREAVNSRPALQEALEMPVPVCHASTLSRFLERLGMKGCTHLIAATVTFLVHRGVLKLRHLIIDTCPIYSPINFKKHAFRQQLTATDIRTVLEGIDWSLFSWLSPRRRGRKTPWRAICAMAVLHHGVVSLSLKKLHEFCQFKLGTSFQELMNENLPGYHVTSRRIRILREVSHHEGIRWLLTCKIHEFLALQGRIARERAALNGWTQAQGFLTNTLYSLDPGARLNYCAAKEQWYFGRGAIIIVDAHTELPVFVHVESQVKLTPKTLTHALTIFKDAYQEVLPPHVELYGDHEFTTTSARTVVATTLPKAHVVTPSSVNTSSSKGVRCFQRLRVAVERCIGRLTVSMRFQHPRMRGTAKVVAMTKFTVLAALVAATYAVLSSRPHLIRSIAFLRR